MKTKFNEFLNENVSQVFTKNAVKSKNGYYEHFNIQPSIASVYGKKPEDVVKLKLKISENQDINDIDRNKADYWGWFDYEKNEFTMVYPKRFLLDMCFPYGMKANEDANQGKSYRLEIIE